MLLISLLLVIVLALLVYALRTDKGENTKFARRSGPKAATEQVLTNTSARQNNNNSIQIS
jgi:hypothetical protein